MVILLYFGKFSGIVCFRPLTKYGIAPLLSTTETFCTRIQQQNDAAAAAETAHISYALYFNNLFLLV